MCRRARAADAARKEVSEEGGAQKSEMDALMEMGKLNTARIRKATDPKIMEVKRRVRQVRPGVRRRQATAVVSPRLPVRSEARAPAALTVTTGLGGVLWLPSVGAAGDEARVQGAADGRDHLL